MSFGHLGIAIQVVQLGRRVLVSGMIPSPHHHPRRLHQPGLDGVVQAEVGHDPVEQAFLCVGSPVGAKGVADMSKQRAIRNSCECDPALRSSAWLPQHPKPSASARFLPTLSSAGTRYAVWPLFVDDHQILAAASFLNTRRTKAWSLSAPFLTTLRSASFSGISGVPVLDQQLHPVQLLARGLGWTQVELVVDVRTDCPDRAPGKRSFHRQPGRHHEDVLREAPALLG